MSVPWYWLYIDIIHSYIYIIYIKCLWVDTVRLLKFGHLADRLWELAGACPGTGYRYIDIHTYIHMIYIYTYIYWVYIYRYTYIYIICIYTYLYIHDYWNLAIWLAVVETYPKRALILSIYRYTYMLYIKTLYKIYKNYISILVYTVRLLELGHLAGRLWELAGKLSLLLGTYRYTYVHTYIFKRPFRVNPV